VGELVDIRPGEDTQGDVHHLKIWQQRSGKEAHARTHNQQLEMGGERTRRGGSWQTFAASKRGNVLGLRPDVVDDWPLEPGDHNVGSLSIHVLQHTKDAAELDCPVTTINCSAKKRRKKKKRRKRKRNPRGPKKGKIREPPKKRRNRGSKHTVVEAIIGQGTASTNDGEETQSASSEPAAWKILHQSLNNLGHPDIMNTTNEAQQDTSSSRSSSRGNNGSRR